MKVGGRIAGKTERREVRKTGSQMKGKGCEDEQEYKNKPTALLSSSFIFFYDCRRR